VKIKIKDKIKVKRAKLIGEKGSIIANCRVSKITISEYHGKLEIIQRIQTYRLIN
jgi:hypothetical protein